MDRNDAIARMIEDDRIANPVEPEPPKFTRGWWGLSCWNALSEEQQTMLIDHGVLFVGHWEPAGGTCNRGAEVEVTTEWDNAPGPRFYCRPCAIKYLKSFDS
jgi:hypothetical protein